MSKHSSQRSEINYNLSDNKSESRFKALNIEEKQ